MSIFDKILAKLYNKDLEKVIADRKIDDGDNTLDYNKKWGLPKGYVRECLTRPDMDEELMEVALGMEDDEDEIMKEYAKETAYSFGKNEEFGDIAYGIDFTKGRHDTAFVYFLTPTLLMYVASHMSRQLKVKELYNPGDFKNFCDEYYAHIVTTEQSYNKIITPDIWKKGVDNALNYIRENFDSSEHNKDKYIPEPEPEME